jgi:uridylate kinase
MGKNGVDGVYDSDPRRNPAARRFDHLTYDRALRDNLQVMDNTALAMCRDHGVTMRVFGLEGAGNVTRALLGEKIGTLMTTHDAG